MKGRKRSTESIEKTRIAMMGFKHSEESIEKMREVKRKYTFTVTSPNGDVYTVYDIKGFAKERGLDYQSLYRVARGVQKKHREWTVTRNFNMLEKTNDQSD